MRGARGWSKVKGEWVDEGVEVPEWSGDTDADRYGEERSNTRKNPYVHNDSWVNKVMHVLCICGTALIFYISLVNLDASKYRCLLRKRC